MSFEEYVGKWFNLFDKELLGKTMIQLGELYKTKNIFPKQSDVFNAFHECNYDDCKVIMLGADPYPQKNVANGILFSNNIHNKSISPSLQVVMKASGSCDKTLTSWCKQGVLMLNSALSVQEGKPSSHLLLWRPFMRSFIRNLNGWETGMIYVLFGSVAMEFENAINKKLNYVLKERHPASYARQGIDMPSTVFNKVNEILKDKYNQTIKW